MSPGPLAVICQLPMCEVLFRRGLLKTARGPAQDSGMSALGITFRTLNKYLKQGGRNLPGRSSLAKEVQAVRGDRPSDGSRDNQ